ncbi:MAG TPA: CocE/NonD family hydrolase, partial [Ignavibacteriaceae bacterium]|nr:CocE/NonD family hydrolase [Ignavibacteriaceae bacterium]
MKKIYFLTFIIMVISTIIFFNSCSQTDSETDYLKTNYDKTEYRIPMRDGVKLYTIVFTPKNKSEEYPILLMRTPYNVTPFIGNEIRRIIIPSKSMIQDGYIFVFQDVRGKFMSEGEFVNMRPHNPIKINDNDIDESSDTYDT